MWNAELWYEVEEQGSSSLCWGLSPSSCSLWNTITTCYLLISSYKQTSDVGLGFLRYLTSGSTTLLTRGEENPVFISTDVFFPLQTLRWTGIMWDASFVRHLNIWVSIAIGSNNAVSPQSSRVFILVIPPGTCWTPIWIAGATWRCLRFLGMGLLWYVWFEVWFLTCTFIENGENSG